MSYTQIIKKIIIYLKLLATILLKKSQQNSSLLSKVEKPNRSILVVHMGKDIPMKLFYEWFSEVDSKLEYKTTFLEVEESSTFHDSTSNILNYSKIGILSNFLTGNISNILNRKYDFLVTISERKSYLLSFFTLKVDAAYKIGNAADQTINKFLDIQIHKINSDNFFIQNKALVNKAIELIKKIR